MSEATNGSEVKVHYTGKLKDGTEFDSSRDSDPLEFTLGEGQVIPGFEEAVQGMNVGESKTFEIAPEEAYGERRDDLVQTVGRDQLPDDLELKEGMRLQSSAPGQPPMILLVSGIEGDQVTLDANHPLAGETLVFDVELVEVG